MAAPALPVRARQAVTYGLMPVAALAATVAVESGERLSLAQAVDGIQDEFGLTDAAIGVLPAAMTIVGVLGSLVIGVLADRQRRTRLLAWAMTIWSAGMVASAGAPSYAALFAARTAVGVVEGNGPAAVSLIGDYYPVRRRARMFGYYQGGALVGGVIGLAIGGIAVDVGGWRWAFWIWVPLGLAVAVWVARIPEPRRGDQDHDIDLDVGIPGVSTLDVTATLELPPSPRIGTLDYDHASARQVTRELFHIRTMWLALIALTVSQFLLIGLQFWAVEFFKRAHGLSAGGAAAFTGTMGAGAAIGVVLGGIVSDRILARGHVNARLYVVAAASLAAPFLLVPAFLIENLWATVPFFLFGGVLLTMPIAPSEAVLNDVIPSPLRGRAAAARSIVRSAAALSPVIIGVLSDQIGLRDAMAWVVPMYAVGGVLVLLACRTYPGDLAFVVAEARRVREDPA